MSVKIPKTEKEFVERLYVAFTAFFNPEYWALSKILGALRGGS